MLYRLLMFRCLRVVLATMRIQQKAVVIKQIWAIILITPHYLLEASGAPAFTLQVIQPPCCNIYIYIYIYIYCTQEAVLSQRAAKCGLHNSVKLSQCLPLVCFVTSWRSGLDHNRTFFVKYVLKSRALYAAST